MIALAVQRRLHRFQNQDRPGFQQPRCWSPLNPVRRRRSHRCPLPQRRFRPELAFQSHLCRYRLFLPLRYSHCRCRSRLLQVFRFLQCPPRPPRPDRHYQGLHRPRLRLNLSRQDPSRSPLRQRRCQRRALTFCRYPNRSVFESSQEPARRQSRSPAPGPLFLSPQWFLRPRPHLGCPGWSPQHSVFLPRGRRPPHPQDHSNPRNWNRRPVLTQRPFSSQAGWHRSGSPKWSRSPTHQTPTGGRADWAAETAGAAEPTIQTRRR
jgi:hypothetical protein